jgi:hypothetical protein
MSLSTCSGRPGCCACPPEAFDLPADHHPAQLRYVGAVLEQPAWAEPWSPPWQPDERRPLVVVSRSTTFLRQERALRRRRLLDAGAGAGHRRAGPGARGCPWGGEPGGRALGTARPGVPACQCRPQPRGHGHRHARWPTACRWSACRRAGTSMTSRPGVAGMAPGCAWDRARPRPGSGRRCTACCTSRRTGPSPSWRPWPPRPLRSNQPTIRTDPGDAPVHGQVVQVHAELAVVAGGCGGLPAAPVRRARCRRGGRARQTQRVRPRGDLGSQRCHGTACEFVSGLTARRGEGRGGTHVYPAGAVAEPPAGGDAGVGRAGDELVGGGSSAESPSPLRQGSDRCVWRLVAAHER